MKSLNISIQELHTECHRLLLTGGRLLNVVCVNRGAGMDLVLKYLFISGGDIVCLNIQTHPNGTVPSVSGLCGAAAYYENVIRDSAGVNFYELTLDYGRHFIEPGEIVGTEIAEEPGPVGSVMPEPPPGKGGTD